MAKQTVPTTGLWSTIAALLDSNFADVYAKIVGVYNYEDLATVSTPISIAVSDTYYNLTNDGLGPTTDISLGLPGVVNVWDTVTNAFDFSDLVLGDTIDIRLDITVTSVTANQTFDVTLFIADGEVGEYEIPFIVEKPFKAAGARKLLRYNGVYIGDLNIRDEQSRFKVRSDGTGSVTVNGWYVRVIKQEAG